MALPETKRKLPDPHGMISRVRVRLNKKCAVAQSPFVEYIISMRMQGIPYLEIEEFLIEQGEQYRIAAPTIWRNLKATKLQVNLTYAEEQIEKLGGMINLNLVREMSQNIITQKERVDRLVRGEQARRLTPNMENYIDRRIRQEMQLYQDLLQNLHKMMQNAPEEAANAAEAQARLMENQGINLSEDAATLLTQMIIDGEIQIGPNDLLPTSKLRH